MVRKSKKSDEKDLVPYANDIEKAAYFLSMKDKLPKKKINRKRKSNMRNKISTKRVRFKRSKLAGNPECQGLEETDCKSNDRCTWNPFEISDFNMNTSKGREKLFLLKESLMKRYTKAELQKYLGSEDPSFFQVYMRAKKEYDSGLRGLCGNKMFRGSELTSILRKRVRKDYPDIRKSKVKIPQKDKDLVEDLLKKAMKKNKPDTEIKAIINKFDLTDKELQDIIDRNNKQFSRLDKFLSVDQDEVSSLLGMVDDEVKLEKELQERLNKLKKSGKVKKTKKAKKAKKKKAKK